MEGIIEAKREYIVTDIRFQKCDSCKRVHSRLFELTPTKKLHGFDVLMLCIRCIQDSTNGFQLNIDVEDLKTFGSVEAWQKAH